MSQHPQIGDAATVTTWTDSHACTVIAASPKRVTLQVDKAVLLNGANSGEPDALTFSPGGFAGHCEGRQRYRYERDPNGRIYKATLRKNGQWRLVGIGTQSPGGHVAFGVRVKHFDYNF